jgi:hypothetical protein
MSQNGAHRTVTYTDVFNHTKAQTTDVFNYTMVTPVKMVLSRYWVAW